MKKHLIKILLGVSFLFIGWNIAERGDKITSQEEMDKLKSFCDNSSVTAGIVEDSYTETTIKIAGGRSKIYGFKYDFQVNGRNYVAESSSSTATAASFRKIWYDKTNPSENSISDPCEQYQRDVKEKTIGSKAFYYVPGVILLLFGIGLVWGTFKEMVGGIFRKL